MLRSPDLGPIRLGCARIDALRGDLWASEDLPRLVDRRSRGCSLGQLVGRYVRWFRNEYGATDSTLRDYEAILSRMSLTLADKEPIDVSVDDLRDVIDLWGERSPRTRQKVTSVVRAFWSWAEEQGHIAISPAARIRRPRAEKRVAPSCQRT